MSHALYRKYRSKRLADVVGQTHITDILSRSLAEGRVAHAYLLTGPRGVGKTSIARILAHEINKLPYTDDSTHLDIIEIDAASNNGVDDIRSLREKVQIAPVSAAKKVYIIDEVHMLSKAAFNALLKTLEEPPQHVVFILATTDSDKLPATIISRTQRFVFRAISVKDAAAHLAYIAKEESIATDSDALDLIALRGDGSFRDSISLLDQLQSIAGASQTITRRLVEDALGLAPAELVDQTIAAYEAKDLQAIVTLLDDSELAGTPSTVLASQLIQSIRSTIATKPHLIHLLDSLLAVAKSSQPSIKLLTTLAVHAVPTPKPKTVALAAPTPVISAPVAELAPPKKAKAAVLATSTVSPAPRSEAPKEVVTPAVSDVAPQPADTIDWDQLINFTRTNYVAVYSVLSKCSYEQTGNKLVLYTGNAFYKKKLDDTKHRINLMEALGAVTSSEWIVDTIGTPPPPKDSQAAAVAAIMGGGEEVRVE